METKKSLTPIYELELSDGISLKIEASLECITIGKFNSFAKFICFINASFCSSLFFLFQ